MSDLEAKKLAVAELKPMAQEENDKVKETTHDLRMIWKKGLTTSSMTKTAH